MSTEIHTYADGRSNTGSGMDALKQFTISASEPAGRDNTAVGGNALSALKTTANENTAVGSNALTGNTTGENTAVGAYAGEYVAGTGNTLVGNWALRYNDGGDENTAIGHRALTGTVSESVEPAPKGDGFNNTAVGAHAMRKLLNGSNNTAVGHSASVDDTLNYATAIGAGAEVKSSNSVVLGRSTDFIGIGTSTPLGSLHVNGSIVTKARLENVSSSVVATSATVSVTVTDYIVIVNVSSTPFLPTNVKIMLPIVSLVPDGQIFVIKMVGQTPSIAFIIDSDNGVTTTFYDLDVATPATTTISYSAHTQRTFVKNGAYYYAIA